MEALGQAAAVFTVLAVVGLVSWLARRGSVGTFTLRALMRNAESDRQMKLIERITLTPQHSIHLIRTHERDLLLVTHPHGCSVVQEQQRSRSVSV